MKTSKILFVAFFILFSHQSFSQNILKRINTLVLIDINERSGCRVGDQLPVFRKRGASEREMGRIVVVQFKNNKCAGKIISENAVNKITVGDFVKQKSSVKRGIPASSYKKDHTITYLSIGTGLAGLGLAYYFDTKANATYKDYKTANTVAKTVDCYEQTISYDKKSRVSMGVGGGLIACGLLYEVLYKPKASKPGQFGLNVKNGFINVCFNF
jgi:hypothetical protein